MSKRRITDNDLEATVDLINGALGQSRKPYTPQADGTQKRHAGTYVVGYAYGGVRLEQLCEGGGSRDVTGRGTKREVYDLMHAFLKGISAAKA